MDSLPKKNKMSQKKKIKKLVSQFSKYNIDGYIVPKNDEFFSENVFFDRLKLISNFSGSAGIAIILKDKNYLFVDGRYTIQAKKESGKLFSIVEIHKTLPYQILHKKRLGFDPKLFTFSQLNYYFRKKNELFAIENNLIGYKTFQKKKNVKLYYSIPSSVTGKSHKQKISLISKIVRKNKADYLFISAPENVAWTLNIRGHDVPFSPIPNTNLIIDKFRNIFLIAKKDNLSKLLKEKKIFKKQIINPTEFKKFISNLSGKSIMIDSKTCSVYNEKIISSNLYIKNRIDPSYLLKSIKTSSEIRNMQKVHINDGVAMTKFIYWIKNNKNKVTEISAEKKLEFFRKHSKNFLYPSFNTIAGAGSNGAIVHYRANKKTNKIIKKKDIFLCDSGGQYKYGTTDVTRTLCFSKPPQKIKNIFTYVLKGHISVVTCNINRNKTGSKIDILARQYLRKKKLDYSHGTGHGVGFFSNVHEGPQSISKYNKIQLKPGMILSNEPGFYLKDKFGIRIENLIYVKKIQKKIFFENLTLVPIDKDLINFNLLSKFEKEYLFYYHLLVYSKISKYLNNYERKWLISNL